MVIIIYITALFKEHFFILLSENNAHCELEIFKIWYPGLQKDYSSWTDDVR